MSVFFCGTHTSSLFSTSAPFFRTHPAACLFDIIDVLRYLLHLCLCQWRIIIVDVFQASVWNQMMAIVLDPSISESESVVEVAKPSFVSGHCTCNGALKTKLMCPPCKWNKLYANESGADWKTELCNVHLKEGRPYLCPIVRHQDYSVFRVGCDPCRRAGSTCRFGSFSVASAAFLQLISFKRHCESPRHIAACKRIGLDVVVSKEAASKMSVSANTPSTAHFLWSLQCQFTHSPCRGCREFVKTDVIQRFVSSNMLTRDNATPRQETL